MTQRNQGKIPSLYEKYKDHFFIGAAVNQDTIDSQQELLKKHFNSITAENEMKFENLQPEEEKFTFAVADKLVSFAKENQKLVRGHTLVWHNQTPDWIFTNKNGSLADRKTVLERMNSHISTVVKRYKDSIYCWDVVNEVIADEGQNLLRESKWLEAIGEDFIDRAFEFAHQADPDALLFYNDYNESHPQKREKIYTLVKGLVDSDVPIHGVGLQAHWNLSGPSYDNIRQAIEKYATLGLQIQLTEMDVSVFDFDDRRKDLTEPTEDMKAIQAERYEGFFNIFREYSDVITGVTFWGAADDYTWLNDFPVKGRKNWPFVFDEKHQPKPSFWKIIQF